MDLGTLMTLKEACEKCFRGQITPATLRAEAGRGKLRIIRIGRRDFVTIADLQEMIELCRLPAVARTDRAPTPTPAEDRKRSQQAVQAALRTARELTSRKQVEGSKRGSLEGCEPDGG
jgi:hypothetical protein